MPETTKRESPSLPKQRRWLRAAIGILVVGLVLLAAWYFTSPRFNAYVRARLVAENDRAIPFDFSGSGVHTSMTLSQADRRYDGTVHVDKIDAQLKDMRPISAVMDAQISLFPRSVQVRSLNISTGHSHAQANGTIED